MATRIDAATAPTATHGLGAVDRPQTIRLGGSPALPPNGKVAAAASARLGRAPAAVVAAIALAWAVSIAAEVAGLAHYVHHDVLLEHGPPFWVALIAFLLAWQLMIAAMMLPSSLPLVRLFAAASRSQPRPRAAMAGFLGGYALAWSVFGALALVFDLGVHRSVDSWGWLHDHEWLIGGSVLAVAGVFQFTRLKDACLDKCRHPAQFMLRYYKRGTGGGFRLGARHGAYCVGCCWALMLVMFAAGVASLLWMALLTALMVHEKTRPAGARAVPVTGVALLASSSIVLLYSAYAAGAI
jgi:predicted metal-binding membrane protein